MNGQVGRSMVLIARLILGGVLLYLGAAKAGDPVTFLKTVHQFGVLSGPPTLNFVAAILPWFEILCGGLLVLGVKARATAFLQVIMLSAFTILVVTRAVALSRGESTPWFALRFDCGCGSGETFAWLKVGENLALITLSAIILRGAREVSGTPATQVETGLLEAKSDQDSQ